MPHVPDLSPCRSFSPVLWRHPVLPVASTTNPETVRRHLHKVADRQDAELVTGQPSLMDEGIAAGQASPLQREAIHSPIEAVALQNRLERIQWRLWHGDAGEALSRARELVVDVAALASGYPSLPQLAKAAAGLATYIENNAAAITDYAERWAHGEIISTAFAESMVNLVVSKRFAKRQQMQWSKAGAHRLLHTRTLDGTLRNLFTPWYPAMPANSVQAPPLAAAA